MTRGFRCSDPTCPAPKGLCVEQVSPEYFKCPHFKYFKYPEAQINDKGEIAIKYRQPGNVLIQGTPSGKEYVAVTQANICMAWIDPADVDFVLAKKDGCCGGKRQSFFLANESDVRRWTNRGGQ